MMMISEVTDYKEGKPVARRESYAGCVLQTYERNGSSDSDFYALVWDEAKGSIESVCYATTRGYTYDNGASVDATPEVIEKCKAVMVSRVLNSLRASDKAAAERPEKGRRVRVTSGRKVAKGTEGTVIWTGADRFKKGLRAGVRADEPGDTFFVDAKCLTVIQPAYANEADLMKQAVQYVEYHAKSGVWYEMNEGLFYAALARVGAPPL